MKTKTLMVQLLAALSAFSLPGLTAHGAEPEKFNGHIDRYDAAFDHLIAPDAKIEFLAQGFTWAEGPVWMGDSLLFSDVPQNTAYRWKPGQTKAEVFLQPSGLLTPNPAFREPGSNGLARDAQGRLLLCQHGERRVARYADGKFTALADHFDGKRFNSPNDLALRTNGDIYFTDPPYGLDGGDKSPLREMTYHGIFRVRTDGQVTLLSDKIRFPNGIAFSPDQKILYIGSTDTPTKIYAFDVQADGTLANQRVFYDPQPLITAADHGGCDGMKVDRVGNIWSSGPGGILVLSPAGKLLGRIYTGVPTANCGWGDDGGTLYITANHFLLRIRTLVKGTGQ